MPISTSLFSEDGNNVGNSFLSRSANRKHMLAQTKKRDSNNLSALENIFSKNNKDQSALLSKIVANTNIATVTSKEANTLQKNYITRQVPQLIHYGKSQFKALVNLISSNSKLFDFFKKESKVDTLNRKFDLEERKKLFIWSREDNQYLKNIKEFLDPDKHRSFLGTILRGIGVVGSFAAMGVGRVITALLTGGAFRVAATTLTGIGRILLGVAGIGTSVLGIRSGAVSSAVMGRMLRGVTSLTALFSLFRGISDVIDNWGDADTLRGNVQNAVADFFNGVTFGLTDWIARQFSFENTRAMFNNAFDALGNIFDGAKQLVQDEIDRYNNAGSLRIYLLGPDGLIPRTRNWLSGVITTTISTLQNIFGSLYDRIYTGLRNFLTEPETVLMNTGDNNYEQVIVGRRFRDLDSIISSIGSFMGNILKSSFELIFGENSLNNFKTYINRQLNDIISNPGQYLNDAFYSLVDSVKSGLSYVTDAIGNFFNISSNEIDLQVQTQREPLLQSVVSKTLNFFDYINESLAGVFTFYGFNRTLSTLGGSIGRLTGDISKFMRFIGRNLVRPLTWVGEYVERNSIVWGRMADQAKNLTGYIQIGTRSLGTIGSVGRFIGKVGGLLRFLGRVAWPITIIMSIADAVKGFTDIDRLEEQFGVGNVNFGTQVAGAIGEIARGFFEFPVTIINWLGRKLFGEEFNIGSGDQIYDVFSTSLNSLFQGNIGEGLGNIFGSLVRAITYIPARIGAWLINSIFGEGTISGDDINAVSNFLGNASTHIGNALGNLITFDFSGFMSGLNGLFTDIFGGYRDQIMTDDYGRQMTVRTRVRGLFGDIGARIVDFVEDIPTLIQENLIDPLVNLFHEIFGWIDRTWNSLFATGEAAEAEQLRREIETQNIQRSNITSNLISNENDREIFSNSIQMYRNGGVGLNGTFPTTERFIDQLLNRYDIQDTPENRTILNNLLQNRKGNIFSPKGIIPFRYGGIVDQTSLFGFGNNNIGSVAEEAPEAIMPILRDSHGNLGVSSMSDNVVRMFEDIFSERNRRTVLSNIDEGIRDLRTFLEDNLDDSNDNLGGFFRRAGNFVSNLFGHSRSTVAVNPNPSAISYGAGSHSGETVGLRQNNPGNLRPGNDIWQGQSGTQNGFLVFSSPEYGIRALSRTLANYRRMFNITTLRETFRRYAPASDNNDPHGYAQFVANALGIGMDDPVDLSDPNVQQALIPAIVRMENGVMPYTAEQISSGIQMASADIEGIATLAPGGSTPPSTNSGLFSRISASVSGIFGGSNPSGIVSGGGGTVRAATRLVHPVPGAPVTSPFGMRMHPIRHVMAMHKGIDFGAPEGTPVGAAAEGIVEMAGPNGGYGNYIRINHGGDMKTAYGHLSAIDVNVGQRVTQRQQIGKVGNTGASRGAHLHFEVLRNGTQVDPAPYLSGVEQFEEATLPSGNQIIDASGMISPEGETANDNAPMDLSASGIASTIGSAFGLNPETTAALANVIGRVGGVRNPATLEQIMSGAPQLRNTFPENITRPSGTSSPEGFNIERLPTQPDNIEALERQRQQDWQTLLEFNRSRANPSLRSGSGNNAFDVNVPHSMSPNMPNIENIAEIHIEDGLLAINLGLTF